MQILSGASASTELGVPHRSRDRGRTARGSDRRHDTRSVGVSRGHWPRFVRRCRAMSRRLTLPRPPRLARWLGGDRLARRRGLRHGPRAGARRTSVGSDAAARLDVRAAADAGHRRRGHLVVVGGSAGERRASDQSRAGSPVRGLRRRPGSARRRARVGSRALRHDAVLGAHGPAPAARAGGRAADRPVRARSRCSCVLSRRPRGGAGSCRSCIRASTRILAFPVVAWIIFASVMWVSHFSPLFDAALEDPLVHDLEHALFLGAGLLFWWPAVALDPAPWRMPHPARALYVFLQMPQNTFLAVVILSAPAVLYPHYATLVRTWGPTAARRSAGGGRHHVARRRRDLPRRGDGHRGRLDAGRGPRHRAARPAGGMPRWPTSGSARGCWPIDSRVSARRVNRGAAPRGKRGTASGRRCPPLTTPTTGPSRSRRPELVAAERDRRERPGRRDGSATRRDRFRRQPDGGGDLRLGHGDDPVEVRTQVREGPSPEGLRPRAVGDRPRHVGRGPADDLARRSSDSRASAASSGSTPMTRAPGTQRLDRRGDAARQPAAADRARGPAATSGSVLGDLEADRALAGDDPIVVVRRDDREAAFRGDRLGPFPALVATPCPTMTISAPSAATRSRLIAGASDGMTTTAGAPSRRAARATPWAWFPDEYVMTPRARSAGARPAMAT